MLAIHWKYKSMTQTSQSAKSYQEEWQTTCHLYKLSNESRDIVLEWSLQREVPQFRRAKQLLLWGKVFPETKHLSTASPCTSTKDYLSYKSHANFEAVLDSGIFSFTPFIAVRFCFKQIARRKLYTQKVPMCLTSERAHGHKVWSVLDIH